MSTGYYLQVILSLLIISGIMWVVLRMTKNLQKQKFSGEMKVVDRIPLSNATALLVVKLREKEYLLSVGGQNVQFLETL